MAPADDHRHEIDQFARAVAPVTRQLAGALRETAAHDAPPRWLGDLQHVLAADLRLDPQDTSRESDWADTCAHLFTCRLLMHGGDSPRCADASPLWDTRLWETVQTALERQAGGTSAPHERDLAEAARQLQQLAAAAHRDQLLSVERRGPPARQLAAHFYETFLSVYDAPQRRRRGVYYTPDAVVSYIVRSVDRLLVRHWQRPLSFTAVTDNPSASPLRIVDPACGCGTFLSATIEHMVHRVPVRHSVHRVPVRHSVHRVPVRHDETPTLADSRRRPADALLGFEILPASCALARLLLGRQLAERLSNRVPGRDTTTPIAPPPALHIHRANPLEEVELVHESLLEGGTQQPVLVVMGNPPYANFGRRNRGSWILKQLEEYKRGLDEKKLNLDDDFIKFLRWGQYWIDRLGSGILAFVTSNTYLSGLTHRQMRRSLCQSFDDMYLLDLHGSTTKRERAPDGTVDENVFDIQTGVAVGIFVKSPGPRPIARVHHAELWGSRHSKGRTLERTDVESTSWSPLRVEPEQYFFVPRREETAAEYQQYMPLDEVFRVHISGVQTKRDALLVAMSREELAERMREYLDPQANRQDRHPTRAEHGGDARGAAGGQVTFSPRCIRPYLVSPFDRRWVYYDRRLLGRARYAVMRHMLEENVALVFMRQSTNAGSYDHFLAVDTLVTDRVFYSAHGAPFLAPLYLYEGSQQSANFEPELLATLAARLNLPGGGHANSEPARGLKPIDVFDYMYAIFHSATYRERYAEQLRIGFPRVPWTSDGPLFQQLAELGQRLRELHLLRSPDLATVPGRLCGEGDNQVDKGFPVFVPPGNPGAHRGAPLDAHARRGRIYINGRQFFEVDDDDVWDDRVGGYQVLNRWLKQRRGRRLSTGDVAHVQRVASALAATRRLTGRIDALIPAWPLPVGQVCNLPGSSV